MEKESLNPIYWKVLAVILVFMAWPIFVYIPTSIVASLMSCPVNEGVARACTLFGADLGPTLFSGSNTIFALMYTIPIGALFLFAWFAVRLREEWGDQNIDTRPL